MRAWCDPLSGLVAWHDVRAGLVRHRRPRRIEFERDLLPPETTERLEREWSALETPIPALLAAIEQGTDGLDDEEEQAAREILALHFGRSRTAVVLEERLTPLAEAAIRMQMLRDEPAKLAAGMFAATGIVPVGPEALVSYAQRHLRPDPAALKRGLGARLEENVQRARAAMATNRIEVMEAATGSEFVLSDVAAMTVKVGQRLGGPLYGVTFSDASTVVLPLSPRYAIAAGPASKRIQLASEHVRVLNETFVMSSHAHVIHRPDHVLEEWVRGIWRPSQP